MQANTESMNWTERCARFASEVIAPWVRTIDKENRFPHEVHTAARKWGLLDQDFPVDLGGAGLSPHEAVAGAEVLARTCAPIAFTMGFNRGALHPIMVAGRPDQKRAFVGELIAEHRYAALCLTEAEGSGSNLLQVATTAVRSNQGWRIDGQKVMVGNGGVASQFQVLARVIENDRPRGLAFFVVPRSERVMVGPNTDKLGFRAVETPVVRFDGVEVSDFHRIGSPGSGEQVVLQTLDFIRVGGASVICGIVAGALVDGVDWARERAVYGGALMTKSHVQIQLGELYARLQMTREMVRVAVTRLTAGQPYGEAASVAKLAASKLAVDTTAAISQLFGWRGIDNGIPHSKASTRCPSDHDF